MKAPKEKVVAPSKKATTRKPNTPSNEAYTALLSNLEAKLAIVEPAAFELWKSSLKSEDLSNWLQCQNQLRITAAHLGKLSQAGVE
jgi:hypothetical protein